MSRTPFPSRRPRRRGGYRPQVEALEGRLAPGSLLGAPECPPADPDDTAERRDREDEELAALAVMADSPHGAIRTTRPVLSLADGSVMGSSTLTRTDHSVSITARTSGLEPGVYTAWWVVINPGSTDRHVGRATARVVGPSGTATFAAYLAEGEILLGHPELSGGSLQDARGAEIRLVIRFHGPVDPGHLFEQMHDFQPDGGVDVQRVIHLPPTGP